MSQLSPAWGRAGKSDLSISLSGGADSTACYLYLLESGVIERFEAAGSRVVRVFMDTGWELPETYAYLDTLEARFGPIQRIATWAPGPDEAPPVGYAHLEPLWVTPGRCMDPALWALAKDFEARIGRYCPMIRLILQWRKVPTSVRRWCTADLKQRPVIGFLKTLQDPINAIGVRAEESRARAAQLPWEWSDDYDAHIWRPIHAWTKQDRIDIHARHGLAPNPLYLRGQGAGRVGCRVCVSSGKADLRWIAEYFPETIDLLRELEATLEAIGSPRQEAGAGSPRWFTLSREGKDWMVPVDQAVKWAKTERGGRQFPLFKPVTDPGCSAWGLCEFGGEK